MMPLEIPGRASSRSCEIAPSNTASRSGCAREKWSEAQSAGEYAVEHRIRRSIDGEYRWHQTRAVPLQSESAEWVGTSTDIHALRQLQGEQQVLLAELQHRTRNLIGVVQAIARKTLRSAGSLEIFAQQFQSRLAALSRVQRLLASMDHRSIELRELIELGSS